MSFRKYHGFLMRAAAHPLAFWGRVLVAVAALSQCFAGQGGQPRLLLLAAIGFPLGLLLVDPSFRMRCIVGAIQLWRDLTRPAAEWRRWFVGFVFVGAPAAFLYVFHPFYHIDSGDTWGVIPTAASVIRQGNVEISEYVKAAPREYRLTPEQDPTNQFQGLPYGAISLPTGIYSRYPAGMTVLALPVAAVSFISGADFDRQLTIKNLDRWSAVCAAVFLLMLFFRIAIRLAPPWPALATTWLLAAGSGVYSTVSQSMWQHGGVAIGILLLINIELDERARRSWRGFALQAFAVGLLYGCRLSSGLLAASFGVWLVTRSVNRGLWYGAASVLGVLPWALFYQQIYGTPLGPSQSQMVASGWQTNIVEPLAGVLFSPARGLFVYQPWVVLAMVGLVMAFRSGLAWMCALAASLHILLIASWSCWYGGSCWGSRLLTEVLPLLAILALTPMTTLLRTRWGAAAIALLLLASAFPHVCGIWRAGVGANWKHEVEPTLWHAPNWPALTP